MYTSKMILMSETNQKIMISGGLLENTNKSSDRPYQFSNIICKRRSYSFFFIFNLELMHFDQDGKCHLLSHTDADEKTNQTLLL